MNSIEAGRWRVFVRSALTAAGGLLAAFLLTALVLDPYDTGRTPFSLKDGVRPQGPRTAAASRGRDQRFAGAVFGNSHIQLVAPDRLREQTGIPFVSMIAPATGPKETLVLLDWWLRHRREPARAVVIGADQRWCTADPAMPNDKPFPFWLFAESFREYALGLIRYDLLEELWRRAGYLLRPGAPRARPDGYWDYEEGYRVQGYETDPRKRADLEIRADSGGGNVTGPFPAVEALRTLFARLGPDVPVVLVRPPVYRSLLPPAGSADARADAACRAALAAFAAGRPRTALVDLKVDGPTANDPNLFFDRTHYRQPVARLIEADIAAALSRLR